MQVLVIEHQFYNNTRIILVRMNLFKCSNSLLVKRFLFCETLPEQYFLNPYNTPQKICRILFVNAAIVHWQCQKLKNANMANITIIQQSKDTK